MKLSKILASVTIMTCLMATSAFAANESQIQSNNGDSQNISDTLKKDKKGMKCNKHKWDEKKFEEFRKDPIKALQNRKAEIQALLKEGKISKEKADHITQKLDSKIKEINEFNKLSTSEKKEKLKNNFKARLEQKVKDGKITQDKANEIIKKHSEKIDSWDGQGFPEFFGKGVRKNK